MKNPNFSYEKKLWQKGYQFVIGTDEVGRGAFAGPVVAGAVSLKTFFLKELKSLKVISSLGINDSKKLSAKKRGEIAKEIKKYFYFGIGEVGVDFINRFGMGISTERVIRQAVVRVIYQIRNGISKATRTPRPWRGGGIEKPRGGKSLLTKDFIDRAKCYLLLDTFHVKYVPVVGLAHQKAIPKGDQKCLTIAAASILAKVYRDNLMVKLSSKYKKYHWEENKGYGTKDHREKIARFGITKLHRKKFVEKWV